MKRNRLILIPILLICGMVFISGCGNTNRDCIQNNIFNSKDRWPYGLLNKIIAGDTHLAWSTSNHTASPTPVGSIGPVKYTSQLKGIIENTKISAVMKQAIRNGISVILVIGDGMGTTHMTLPSYLNLAQGIKQKTYFDKIMANGSSGLCLTNPYGVMVTDSAAAGTAIACGTKTRTGILGMDHTGKELTSVLDDAEKLGMATGLISDTRITHATPACFYANIIDRNKEEDIASQLTDDYKIEVIMGGGAAMFIPDKTKTENFPELKDMADPLHGKSRRSDNRNLLKPYKESGYAIVSSKKTLKNLPPATKKILGLFSAMHMNTTIDRDEEDTGEPSIIDMTSAGIKALSGNRQGFFLMVECGRLDYEGHYNDIGALIKTVNEMNDVLGICYNYYQKNRNHTLLIFTGDHETGGLGISYYRIKGKKKSMEIAKDAMWSPETSALSLDIFKTFLNQKKSLRKIFSIANSSEDVFNEINSNTPFTITEEEADDIYSILEESKEAGYE